MAVEKVLISVKTYPTISKKYDELVCTAGFREDGNWIRLYPVPFRKLDYNKQYRKYQWMELDLVKNTSDFRPESYRPRTIDTQPKILDSIDTKYNWKERKKYALKEVYDDLSKLIDDAKGPKKKSLATFKPTLIKKFYYEPVEREWDQAKIALMNQLNLFEEKNKRIQVVRKLPYKFKYRFEDVNGKESNMMIEDWEVGALYWNCFEKYQDEKIACEKVLEKYYTDFALTKDLYFYMGTTFVNHVKNNVNPFVIIGTFHPKKVDQLELF